MPQLVIPGEPTAKARPRVTRSGHTYTPDKTRQAEDRIREAWQASGHAKIGGPLRLIILAYFKRPAKPKPAQSENAPCTKRPDADNIGKLIADALNGHAYDDDSAIVSLTIEKRYSDTPRVEITLQPYENAQDDTQRAVG